MDMNNKGSNSDVTVGVIPANRGSEKIKHYIENWIQWHSNDSNRGVSVELTHSEMIVCDYCPPLVKQGNCSSSLLTSPHS